MLSWFSDFCKENHVRFLCRLDTPEVCQVLVCTLQRLLGDKKPCMCWEPARKPYLENSSVLRVPSLKKSGKAG